MCFQFSISGSTRGVSAYTVSGSGHASIRCADRPRRRTASNNAAPTDAGRAAGNTPSPNSATQAIRSPSAAAAASSSAGKLRRRPPSASHPQVLRSLPGRIEPQKRQQHQMHPPGYHRPTLRRGLNTAVNHPAFSRCHLAVEHLAHRRR
uniref:Uncharacterized protein n=1 Tax=Mycobacterium celatum TaxID=28045 RepID=Q93S52_MYCCE|nr:unknown [Mycobacterium celatum]